MARRPNLPQKAETEVLLKSRRKCCLCYFLDNDDDPKAGQIAHLDQNRANNVPDNLVWLCLPHHDQYDTKTSQSKGLTLPEVKAHRNNLYKHLIEQDSAITGDDVDARISALTEIAARYEKLSKVVPSEDAKKKNAEAQRADCEAKVSEGKWRDFKTGRVTLAVSIIPLEPPEQTVRLDDPSLNPTTQLAPIGFSYGALVRFGTSRGFRFPHETHQPATHLTEMNPKGSIFAGADWLSGKEPPEALQPFRWSEGEKELVQSLPRYIRFLRQIGINGILCLGISLLRTENSVIPASASYVFIRGSGARVYNDPQIVTETIRIPPDFNPTFKSVADLIKPAMEHIWGEYNLPPMNYEENIYSSWDR